MTLVTYSITVIQNLFHNRHTVVQTNHTRAQNLLYINSKSARNDTRGERKCNSIISSSRLFVYRHGNL